MTVINDYKASLQKLLKKQKIEVDVDILTEHTSSVVSQWIPTGCLALDAIIGSGIPVGRVIEIYGDESTGKSLVSQHIAAEALDAGHLVVYADSEATMSVEMLENVGVDTEKLLYFIPDTMEDVFKTFAAAIEVKPKDSVLVLIWDSVAASATKAEMDAEYGKAHMAPQARVMSASLRKLTQDISKKDIVAVFTNQTRQKIGVMFGSSVSTVGGNALKFYASVRIELSTQSKIMDDLDKPKKKQEVSGVLCRAYVTKNKVSKPFQKCVIPILFDHGMYDAGASLEYMKAKDIIKTSGSWFVCEELSDKKFQTKDWEKIYDEKFDIITQLMGLS